MIILISGASHTGKTLLAQKLLEKYKYPVLSIDLLKMGLIRSNNTSLTPEDDEKLEKYLWPIVREMIKTAIENKQNLIVEGAYIPFDWKKGFDVPYLRHILFYCLVMTRNYIRNHFADIKKYADMFMLNLNDTTRTLSGGEKERLIAASILAMGHKIIVLDEPLANLDMRSSIILMDKLEELKNNGYAILVIEHRTDIIKKYIDKLYYLDEGKINLYDVSILDGNFSSMIILPKSNNIGNKILEIKNLNYKVKKKTILENINLDIYEGEKLLIKGENGAGKTTLIKAITGVLKLKKNMIKSKDTKFKSKKWYKEIGVVYQNPNYQLIMKSVFDEVRFYTSSDEEAESYLKRFNLYEYSSLHPQLLSLGQKRKLTVLCALAKKPRIIILDEPTVGQDFSSLKMICGEIEAYHENSNATIITITHDQRCQDAFCDRSIEVKNGKLID